MDDALYPARGAGAATPTALPRCVSRATLTSVRSSVPDRPAGGAVLDVTIAADPNHHAVALDAPLLTADEIAALLAVPRSSVYEYARRRVDPLPSLLIGRHRRFDRQAIERWLARQAARGE